MPTLDGTKTMRRQISIEIINDDPSSTKGLKVYQRKDKFTSRLIARGVDEGQLEQVLNDRQWTQYESGKWAFKVSAQSLCEVFQWLP
jgi:hypothetical protein